MGKLASIISASVALCTVLAVSGCTNPTSESEEDGVTAEAPSAVIATGLHGAAQKSKASAGSVVSEYLAKNLSDNVAHKFWWFCGQGATATAINFARGTTPNDTTKLGQLQWIHDRLKVLHADYSVNDPVGPYAAKITWLSSLMSTDKSDEFITATLSSSNRETVKANMTQALDNGAYIVALNQTSGGVGHYLTVYAIDYQPAAAGGGTVYYGDDYDLVGKLGSVDFKTFLDRMLSQSNMGIYNAFSIKKK